MRGTGRAVKEVPGSERSLLPLDDRHALPRQHEKVLLLGLGVVEPARLARVDDLERDTELGKPLHAQLGTLAEHSLVRLEHAPGPETVVLQPGRLTHVDDEPPACHRGETGADVLEGSFVDHRCAVRYASAAS
jgi:hypothetical protein